MIVLGLILILVGYLLPVPPPVVTIGWVLVIIGLILLLVHGAVGYGGLYY